MRFCKILVAAAFLSLSACTYWQKVPLTGRDHVSGWADQIRAAAAEAYVYAQMSVNAYDDSDRFDLGPAYINVRNADNDDIGFAYSLFERRVGDRLEEVIIAFRGTEFSTIPDWTHGNVLARQNERGLALYDRLRAETDRTVPITVTGHSLGGGIATHVSLRRPGVRSYIFNSSPRFSAKGEIPENRRLSIVEYGEALKVARLPGREAPQTYISINCRRGVSPLGQHRSRPLAVCLTRIAAFESSEARASLDRNKIGWPPGLTRD